MLKHQHKSKICDQIKTQKNNNSPPPPKKNKWDVFSNPGSNLATDINIANTVAHCQNLNNLFLLQCLFLIMLCFVTFEFLNLRQLQLIFAASCRSSFSFRLVLVTMLRFCV